MNEDNYEDIINQEYKKSANRTPMSIESRSAQFAPFSALSGYAESINEVSRITDNRINIDDYEKEILNNKLIILKKQIKLKPIITVKYFVSDKLKDGGKYSVVTGNLDKIKEVEGYIKLTNYNKIYLKDIISIDSDSIKLN